MKKYLIMALTAMLLGGAAASAKTAQTASKGKDNAPATKQYIGGSFSLWYEAGQNGSSGAFTAAIVPTYGWNFNKSFSNRIHKHAYSGNIGSYGVGRVGCDNNIEIVCV